MMNRLEQARELLRRQHLYLFFDAGMGVKVLHHAGPLDVNCRLFGRPIYWQGENEWFDDDTEEQDGTQCPDPGEGSGLLLFQDEFGEGNIHVWLDDADARNRDFSQCWISYSGT